jgi:hypothetical protein
MRIEAIENTLYTLKNYEGHYSDLHNEVFNTDYYIIGTWQAKEALKEYDVFDAIEVVHEYEYSNFGEIYTDASNPEKLINMLFYIIGEEVLSELESLNEHFDRIADHETNEIIRQELCNMLNDINGI